MDSVTCVTYYGIEFIMESRYKKIIGYSNPPLNLKSLSCPGTCSSPVAARSVTFVMLSASYAAAKAYDTKWDNPTVSISIDQLPGIGPQRFFLLKETSILT